MAAKPGPGLRQAGKMGVMSGKEGSYRPGCMYEPKTFGKSIFGQQDTGAPIDAGRELYVVAAAFQRPSKALIMCGTC